VKAAADAAADAAANHHLVVYGDFNSAAANETPRQGEASRTAAAAHDTPQSDRNSGDVSW